MDSYEWRVAKAEAIAAHWASRVEGVSFLDLRRQILDLLYEMDATAPSLAPPWDSPTPDEVKRRKEAWAEGERMANENMKQFVPPRPAPPATEPVMERVPDGIYQDGDIQVMENGTAIAIFVDEEYGYVEQDLPHGWQLQRPADTRKQKVE